MTDSAAQRQEKALAMLREHAASLDPDSFVSEVIRVLEGEDEAPTAATGRELQDLRAAYGKKFNAVTEALGLATQAQELAYDGYPDEALSLLDSIVGVLRDA